MSPPDESTTEVAILRLQSSLDLGLEAIRGQLGLILQRLDQQDRRTDDIVHEAAAVADRVRSLEHSAVTHGELDRQRRRTVALTTVIVSVVAVLVPAGISIIAIVVT